MVLNALNHDPQRTWKGPWRWNSEEIVQCAGACGHSLEAVRRLGGVEDVGQPRAIAREAGVERGGRAVGKRRVRLLGQLRRQRRA